MCRARDVGAKAGPRWSVLVPFFNERALLPDTLASLAAQTRAVRVILIDNGSTDGGGTVAQAVAERLGMDYLLVTERRAGKVHALAAGLRWVDTRYVATCDADTWYPADYLAQAEAVLHRGHAIAGAFFVGDHAEARARAGRKMIATARAPVPHRRRRAGIPHCDAPCGRGGRCRALGLGDRGS